MDTNESLPTERKTLSESPRWMLRILIVGITLLWLGLSGCANNDTPSSDTTDEVIGTSNNADRFKPAQKILGLQAQRKTPEIAPSTSENSETVLAGGLILRYLDVGQGDSALISCNDKHLLIDGGPPSASSKLYSMLKNLDITELKYIIATHPDADHIGGIPGALNYATCETVFCSTNSSDTKTFESMVRYLHERNGSLVVPTAGQSFDFGGATLTFLGPLKHYQDDNNNSLITRLDYGDTSFLFTGDAELEEESDLYEAGWDISADVLKVAHHGSNSSTSATFIDKVHPLLGVISVGENSYGHPDVSVLNSFAAHNIPLLRTDLNGDITVISDGHTLGYEVAKGTIS